MSNTWRDSSFKCMKELNHGWFGVWVKLTHEGRMSLKYANSILLKINTQINPPNHCLIRSLKLNVEVTCAIPCLSNALHEVMLCYVGTVHWQCVLIESCSWSQYSDSVCSRQGSWQLDVHTESSHLHKRICFFHDNRTPCCFVCDKGTKSFPE